MTDQEPTDTSVLIEELKNGYHGISELRYLGEYLEDLALSAEEDEKPFGPKEAIAALDSLSDYIKETRDDLALLTCT